VCAKTILAGLAHRLSRLGRCRSGVAAVEFAFVSPLLISLLVGIYSVGSVMHCLSSVRYALEDTARLLQMNPALTESDLQTAIDSKLTNYGKEAVTLKMTVSKDAAGSDVARLTATYPYLIAVPFIPEYEGAYKQSVDIFLIITK
jgi:Flp pilus assembly protein TadG